MTLGEWLDRWMEDYGSATLRPNTLRSYEQFIRCYIKPYLGDKIVSRVTRMDIQKLYRKLKHKGRVREHPEYGHELSDTMVLRIHAMLHRCLKDAEAAHVVARNPTDGAVVPKASYKPKQILTKEQMETFLADPHEGADGDLPGGGGPQRDLAGLLLHRADHRSSPGRDLRAHVAGLRREGRDAEGSPVGERPQGWGTGDR